MAANRDSLTVAGMTEKVSEAVAKILDQIVDCHRIVLDILDALGSNHNIHTENVDSQIFADYIAYNIHKAIDKRSLGVYITRGLEEAGFADKPAVGVSGIGESMAATATGSTAMAVLRPQPSMSMDVTVLREQILGALPNHLPLTYTN